MSDLQRALEIAVSAHKGQSQKSGSPYVLHPLKLMFSVQSEAAQICAVLHDVIEDTHWELDALRAEGFSKEVIDALDCLTHQEGIAYEDYIEKISNNALATKVKLADLKDNMNVRRLPTLNANALSRIEKYHKAWVKLSGPVE